MRLITSKSIMGQMARWAVELHPFHEPTGLFEICGLIDRRATDDFKDGPPFLPMRWFDDAMEIDRWLHAVLDNHPTLMIWNTPRSKHTQSIVFSSRYDRPSPEDDFIDLDALLRNVALHAWRDAEEFERKAA